MTMHEIEAIDKAEATLQLLQTLVDLANVRSALYPEPEFTPPPGIPAPGLPIGRQQPNKV